MKTLILLTFFTYGIYAVAMSRGNMSPKVLYRYLAFDNPLSSSTSQMVFSNNTVYTFARRFYDSTEYLWLERDLTKSRQITYQERNYKEKYALFMGDYTIKAVFAERNELKYLVCVEKATGKLYIIEMVLAYLTRSPLNLDYRYEIKGRKAISKTVELKPKLLIKRVDYTEISTDIKKRIIVAGTTTVNTTFLAVYNLQYNLTEFIFEESSKLPEICVGLEIDTVNDQVIVISSVNGGTPSTSPWKVPTEPGIHNIIIRAFSLEESVLKWVRVIGHDEFNDSYVGSGIMGNYLMIMYNVDGTHDMISKGDIELMYILLKTGEGSNDCNNILRVNRGVVKGLELVTTNEEMFYVLLNVTKGVLTFVKTSTDYTFAVNSLAIALFSFDDSVTVGSKLSLLDIIAYDITLFRFTPSRLILYYPYLEEKISTPEILLASHIDEDKLEGLILYGFEDIKTPQSDFYLSGQNPFITSTNCGHQCERCLYSNPNKCLTCDINTKYRLANNFQCTSLTCLEGYYLTESMICKKCHVMCKTCSGPLDNQCTACKSTNAVLSTLNSKCYCPVDNYITEGKCVGTCPISYLGTSSDYLCHRMCPENTLYMVSYDVETAPSIANQVFVNEGKDMLEFQYDSASCLELPGPIDALSVPSQFTISFWIYVKQIEYSDSTAIVWGFNNFVIESHQNRFAFVIRFDDNSETSTGYGSNAFTGNKWFFVAGSLKSLPNKIHMSLYTGGKESVLSELSTTLSYKKPAAYYNKLILVCDKYFDPNSKPILNSARNWLNGYIRELVYQSQYHSLASMQAKKNLVYSSYLNIYGSVLAYWRFDSLNSTVTDSLLHDLSRYGNKLNITGKTNPIIVLNINDTSACKSSWDDFGMCIDIFANVRFPKFTLDVDNFAHDYIELGMNTLPKNVLKTIVRINDRIQFSFYGCFGENLLEVKVTLNEDDSVSIEKNKRLTERVYGRHVDICYSSPGRNSLTRIGQVYFPQLPTQIYPQRGYTLDSSPEFLTFDLRDGDQCEGDTLSLYDINSDVSTGVADCIRVDEDDLTLNSKRKSNREFSSMSTSGFTPGIYTVIWKPSYITYKDIEGLVAYKNLYVTWAIQEIPKVKFNLIPEIIEIYDNRITFKGGSYHPDLMGEGQTDGDQLMFCYMSCQFTNHRGQIYTRKNSMYPLVWFGEETGVYNLLKNKGYFRLYLCWRPAATASTVSSKDDIWYNVKEYYRKTENAYIEVDEISENEDLPEIIATSPPMTDPVLRPWESISFTLSKCRVLKPKLSSYNGVPGKVQIVHVSYLDSLRADYETEVIWEQKFVSGITEKDGFVVGNLHGDPETCTYTLYELPYTLFSPGDNYALIIYSRSFKSDGMDKYLFGNLDVNLPAFKLFFTYQEVIIENGTHTILGSENAVVITGKNLGDVTIQGFKHIEEKKLFGIVVKVSVDSECEVEEILGGYILNSWASSNPNQIRLSGVDLSTCNGNVTADLTLIKVANVLGSSIWTFIEINNIYLGIIGCHSSCLTCSNITDESCTSCRVGSERPYLYKGMCLSKCPFDLPYVQPVFERNTYIVSYYMCVSACAKNCYLERELKTCYRCNSGCRTCDSDKSGGCLSCYGVSSLIYGSTWEVNNSYHEYYYFNGMCISECPVIINDVSTEHENLIIEDYYMKNCTVNESAHKDYPIWVNIDFERVNVKDTLILRATLDDPTGDFAKITWTPDPAEDTSIPDFYNSDERVFYNYEESDYDSLTKEINMNTFNYRGAYDQLRVMAKAVTRDSVGFGYAELYKNTPPELRLVKTSIIPPDIYQTNTYIDIYLNETQDVDDYSPILKYNVLLVTSSIVLPEVLENSSSRFQYESQAQLIPTTQVIYSSRIMKTINNSIILTNVFIPPLLNKPMIFEGGIFSDVISCDLIILCEDRNKHSSRIKTSINITETYRSTMRTSELSKLHNKLTDKNLTWDDALMTSHILKVVAPKASDYNLPYQYCAHDSHCNNGGKCRIQEGFSKCACAKTFDGKTCDWKYEEINFVHNITKLIIDFLYDILINPKKVIEEDQLTIAPHNILNQLADVLIGILKNPESLSDEHIGKVISLTKFMSNMTLMVALKLESYEMENILNATDFGIQYIMYNFKEIIHKLNLLENRRFESLMMRAEFDVTRQKMASVMLEMRDALYLILNKLSNSLYVDSEEYTMSFKTFSFYLAATTEFTFFRNLKEELGVRWLKDDAYFQFPVNLLKDVRNQIPKNEKFTIRAVLWKENIFAFSDYSSSMCTNIYNLAILDSKTNEIELNLEQPILLFLPMDRLIKTNASEDLSCKLFNSFSIRNITSSRRKIHNVNLLNDSERQKYPEWNPENFIYNDLIVGDYVYTIQKGVYPDFESVNGISSYGNIIEPQQYRNQLVPCAAYRLGDIVAVVHRRQGDITANLIYGLYDHFYSWDRLRESLGFYISIILVGMLIVSWVASLIVDIIYVPGLHAKLEANRIKDIIRADKGEYKVMLKKASGNRYENRNDGQSVSFKSNGDNNISNLSAVQIKASNNFTTNEGSPMNTINKSDNDVILVPENLKEFSKKEEVETINKYSEMNTNDQNLVTNHNLQTTEIEERLGFVNNKLSRHVKGDITNPREIGIFAKDHRLKREEEQFTIFNLYLNSNILINLIMRTNTVYPRTSRCILFYVQLFMMFTISGFIIEMNMEVKSHREEVKGTAYLLMKDVWIMFLVPVIEGISMIFYGSLFKTKESALMTCYTVDSSNEFARESRIKLLMSYILTFVSIALMSYYLCYFSVTYERRIITEWIYITVFAIAIEIMIYDVLIALMVSIMYKLSKRIGMFLKGIRACKYAEYQE